METNNTTVREAINESVLEGGVVRLTIRGLSSNYDPVVTELERIADDWVAANDLEYWGATADGDKWRIHVERRG